MCEVGDLSGKFGLLFPTTTSSGDRDEDSIDPSSLFQHFFLRDPMAPVEANFNANEGDMISSSWSSVAFHCSTGEPLLCSSLRPARCDTPDDDEISRQLKGRST